MQVKSQNIPLDLLCFSPQQKTSIIQNLLEQIRDESQKSVNIISSQYSTQFLRPFVEIFSRTTSFDYEKQKLSYKSKLHQKFMKFAELFIKQNKNRGKQTLFQNNPKVGKQIIQKRLQQCLSLFLKDQMDILSIEKKIDSQKTFDRKIQIFSQNYQRLQQFYSMMKDIISSNYRFQKYQNYVNKKNSQEILQRMHKQTRTDALKNNQQCNTFLQRSKSPNIVLNSKVESTAPKRSSSQNKITIKQQIIYSPETQVYRKTKILQQKKEILKNLQEEQKRILKQYQKPNKPQNYNQLNQLKELRLEKNKINSQIQEIQGQIQTNKTKTNKTNEYQQGQIAQQGKINHVIKPNKPAIKLNSFVQHLSTINLVEKVKGRQTKLKTETQTTIAKTTVTPVTPVTPVIPRSPKNTNQLNRINNF